MRENGIGIKVEEQKNEIIVTAETPSGTYRFKKEKGKDLAITIGRGNMPQNGIIKSYFGVFATRMANEIIGEWEKTLKGE